MCGSHREAWRRCDGALLVILSVIYLEFKPHITRMATTAFCSDTPSHLVCAWWDYHLYFNRTITQHTSRLCKGYLTKKESDGVLHQMTWPPQSPDLNPYVGSPRLLEKHSSCSWLRLSRVDNAVIKAKGGYFEESQI
jgi:hypothetical protein